MDIFEKISTVTTISDTSLKKFLKYVNSVHSHDIVTGVLSGNDVIELPIFEGTILLKLENDEVRYKFIPSDSFNQLVVNSIINKKSELVDLSERGIGKLLKMYKEII